MAKNKIILGVASVLGVAIIALGVALVLVPQARYDAGVKQGEHKQLEVIKSDPNKGIVPDVVGQNLANATYVSWGDEIRLKVNNDVSLGLKFKTPNGEQITQDNTKDYKIVSQNPKGGTIFDVQYDTDENGKQDYDGFPKSTGIQEVTLTVEKVSK